MMKNLLLTVLMIAGLIPGWPPANAGAGSVFIDAAGATFPSPLYRQWFKAYQEQTGVRLSYTDTGSGEGIRRLLKHTVDIGASDVFLSDAEMAALPAEVIHLPTCLGAVAIIYNLPGSFDLRLTPDVIARLFLGDLSEWSDPAIAADNPDQRLPSLPVLVVHRSESSGTTFLFSDYLTKTSDRWRQQAGCAKRIPWPVGFGTEGNPGVAELVSRIPGSIGYVSLTYAAARNLPVAAVRNRSGRFLKPSLETVTAAAEGPVPSDTRVLFTDTPAADGYPISAFTYLLLYREQAYAGKDRKKAQGMVDFLGWALTEGQRHAAPLFYAPLPSCVVDLALARLRTVTYRGEALWPK